MEHVWMVTHAYDYEGISEIVLFTTATAAYAYAKRMERLLGRYGSSQWEVERTPVHSTSKGATFL